MSSQGTRWVYLSLEGPRVIRVDNYATVTQLHQTGPCLYQSHKVASTPGIGSRLANGKHLYLESYL